MDGRAALGRSGERIAARYLERRGHEILDRNWRHGRFEVDLVAREDAVVAFVEVKTRRGGVEPPADGLSPAQRRRIRRASEAWIHANPGVGAEFRFDLVAIDLEPGEPPKVDHIRSAFLGDDAF